MEDQNNKFNSKDVIFMMLAMYKILLKPLIIGLTSILFVGVLLKLYL